MSLADVDGQKVGAVLVIVIELNDIANLATEGRSSEAAENENEWTASGFFANVESRGAVERDQAGIRRLVADFQVSTMHMGEGVADHVQSVLRPAGHQTKQNVSSHEKNQQ
jgi:hypothetical protein